MNPHREQAQALMAAGKRDAFAMQLLIETKRAPHETIGFLAQQACEKFIKAMLVLHGVRFERTHDLVALHDLATQNGIDLPADVDRLRTLNSYAVQFRYEGCPIEMVSSTECDSVTTTLQAWVEIASGHS